MALLSAPDLCPLSQAFVSNTSGLAHAMALRFPELLNSLYCAAQPWRFLAGWHSTVSDISTMVPFLREKVLEAAHAE